MPRKAPVSRGATAVARDQCEVFGLPVTLASQGACGGSFSPERPSNVIVALALLDLFGDTFSATPLLRHSVGRKRNDRHEGGQNIELAANRGSPSTRDARALRQGPVAAGAAFRLAAGLGHNTAPEKPQDLVDVLALAIGGAEPGDEQVAVGGLGGCQSRWRAWLTQTGI